MNMRLAAAVLSLLLISIGPCAAQSDDQPKPCLAEHRFWPGPIVNGHNRQPTAAEFERRVRELQAQDQNARVPCRDTVSVRSADPR